MSYDAEAIANHFLDLADAAGKPITAMQLQKLIYFAHGWHLAFTGQPLIRQRMEAWTYGPVVPEVYHEFKHFGARPLVNVRACRRDGHIANGKFETDFTAATLADDCPDPKQDEVRNFLARVFQAYGSQSGPQLSAMTHVPDGPWAKARIEAPWSNGPWIDDALIRDYFRQCQKDNKAY